MYTGWSHPPLQLEMAPSILHLSPDRMWGYAVGWQGPRHHGLPPHPSRHYYNDTNGLVIPRLQTALGSTQSWETLQLTFVDLGQVSSEPQFPHN